MKHLKSAIAAMLVLSSALAIIIPLPSGNQDHLLSEAEAQSTTFTIYSGRNEELVGPLLEQFELETGIEVEVVYGSTSALALQILEEGENSPADVFFAQDAGALGLVANEGLLDTLPSYIVESVDPRFASPDGLWVGVSGRARVLVYNTELVSEDELPASIYDLTGEAWADGVIGWAPTNGSLHAHLTAMRVLDGDDAMRGFVEGIIANEAREYDGNSAVLAGVAAGEIEVGLVNHYYLYAFLRENPDAPLANYYFPAGDSGALINVAGAAMLASSDAKPLAQQFIAYLLSRSAQGYFAETTFEYPLLFGMEADERLLPLEDIETPEIDLSDLADLETTLAIFDEIRGQ